VAPENAGFVIGQQNRTGNLNSPDPRRTGIRPSTKSPSPYNAPSVASYPLPPCPCRTVNQTPLKLSLPNAPLLLCAPSEEEEIKWLSAICALIAAERTWGCTWGVAAWHHCRDDIVVWRIAERPSWRFRDSWNKRGLKRQKSTVERQRIDCTRGGRLESQS